MKTKFLKWTGLVLVLSICIQACKYETDIPNPQDYAKVYMPQAVDNTINYTFTVSDTIKEIVFGAAYGGPSTNDENIQVQFEIRPELMDDYNEINGTSYEMLPPSNFEFTETATVMP